MEPKGKETAEGPPDSACRYWGEEREDDAVYSVYLKKISYKKAAANMDASTQYDYCRESRVRVPFLSSMHLQWETTRVRTIKAASVRRLVEYLPIAVQEMDSVYINVFFSTYQTFTTLKEALDILLARYIEIKGTATEPERKRKLKNIRSVILMWLDESQDCFREGPGYPCLHMVERFAREVMHDQELQLRTQLAIATFREEDSPKKPEGQPRFQFSVCDEVDFMMLGTVGYHDIREIDSKLLAEQLTHRESELFRKVIPQHCLGSIWSRRDKKRGVDPMTVTATVNQFNDITMKVMTTILEDKSLRPSMRALTIAKWIDVAQACRELKNFSALKAIISALQSHPIHRLRRSWHAVTKAQMTLFEDLANIFLDDNNFETWREIINKEGTAKFATVSPKPTKKVTRSLRKMMSSDKLVVQKRDSLQNRVNGTVPYLGTFLTDLIKLDTAFPDVVHNGLINFEKKRKEFEVVAQIRLLQMASKNYQILSDDKFREWFDDIQVMTYEQCCEFSDEIESALPDSEPTTPTHSKNERPRTYRKFFSFTDNQDSRHRHRALRRSSTSIATLFTNNNSNVYEATDGSTGADTSGSGDTNGSISGTVGSGHTSGSSISGTVVGSGGSMLSGSIENSGGSAGSGRTRRSRTGPGAKSHSSTSSISSTSSTPSSDDSMSIASMDAQSPASTGSTASSASSSSSASSTSSGSASLSMSTTSSVTEASSRASSMLSVENSPAKSHRALKPSLSLSCLSALDRQQHSSSSPTSPNGSRWDLPSESCRIIRVGLEEELHPGEEGNIYRSLVISHQEHTPSVIKNTLSKHHMPEHCDYHDFELVQLLDEKELVIPDDANVFYAMNASCQPHFVLRKKSINEVAPDSGSYKKKSLRGGSTSGQKNSKRLHIKRMSWVKVRDDSR